MDSIYMDSMDITLQSASIPELERMYSTFRKAENKAGIATPEGKMLSANILAVCDELENRREGQRIIFLILQDNLAEIDTEELQDFHQMLVDLTRAKEGSQFEEHFTEYGDPISDAGSIFESFIWFVEEKLKERGADWRAVYNK